MVLGMEIAVHPIIGMEETMSPVEQSIVDEGCDSEVREDLHQSRKVSSSINTLRGKVWEEEISRHRENDRLVDDLQWAKENTKANMSGKAEKRTTKGSICFAGQQKQGFFDR